MPEWTEVIKKIFSGMGDNPDREGLQDTPLRMIQALLEMTQGYKIDPSKYLEKQFTADCDEMVVVKNVPFVSLCEHHVLPFWGNVTLAYVPDQKIVGLSKIPRTVQALAQRLQVQERLTTEIAECFDETVKCKGVAVRITGEHSCMKFRGIKSDGIMETTKLLGEFAAKPEARNEFLELCKGAK